MKREFLPRLAREHGITEEFCKAVKVLDLHPFLVSLTVQMVCNPHAQHNDPVFQNI